VLRATAQLVALAFLIAGVTGLFRAKSPGIAAPAGMPVILVTLICFLAAELGDKTQFTTAALAAHYDSLALAAFGATAGIFIANVPAAMFAARFGDTVPVRKIRLGVSITFIMVGMVVALRAMRLV
jgi:putative Ca2+/H+ antiporter (TMEM165/GDT1 family)